MLFVGLFAGCPEPSEDPPAPDYEPPDVEEALQACAELPEAAAAQWVPGTPIEPTGTSSSARLVQAGGATWTLALDLLQATESDRSVVASPTAMSVSMGMAKTEYEGQQCGDQIQAHMHFIEEWDALHQTLGAVIGTLEGRALPAEPYADPVDVSLTPSIWSFPETGTRRDLPAYGASVHTMGADREAARVVMNCVVEAQTRGLITDFIPQGQPHAATTSVDLLVPYLQAPWESALDDAGQQPFVRDDGTEVSLPSMTGELAAGLHQGEQRWALDLPLRGDLSVLLVMPAPQQASDMDTFVDGLSPAALQELRASLRYDELRLLMPKVDIPHETIDYYDPLGFDCEPFTVDTLLHGATIQMDEKGVKATAAAYTGHWGTGGEPPELLPFTIDRPFLFFVYDRPTNFVLFSGRFAG